MIFHGSYSISVFKDNGVWNAICEAERHDDPTPLGEGKGDSEAQAVQRAFADHMAGRQKVA